MQLKQPNLKNFVPKDDTGSDKVTPMMSQYLEVKRRHEQYLLFYRMGDFYELFFDDAKIAAKELGITLTKRGKFKGADIPMCGVPYHSSQNYLSRLIKAGFKVAVAEQLENPNENKQQKNSKIFLRDVVRIITPGTILEETLLEPKKNNYLLSIFWNKEKISVSWVDVTTSEFRVRKFKRDKYLSYLEEILFKTDPQEIIICEGINDDQINNFFLKWKHKITKIPEAYFDFQNNTEKIKKFFNTNNINSLGEISNLDICSLGSIVEYMQITQKDFISNLCKLNVETDKDFLVVDKISTQSLEIFNKMNGEKNGSLLYTIDQTLSSGGARLIKEHLKNPLKEKKLINQRLNCVNYFLQNSDLTEKIRLNLNGLSDVERSIARLSANLNNPRDCRNVSNFIEKSLSIISLLETKHDVEISNYLISQDKKESLHNLSRKIETAIVENGPTNILNGGFINDGFSNELDKHRTIKMRLQDDVIKLQFQYSNEVGVNTLKIKFNNFHGYFIEVTNKNHQRLVNEKDKFDLIQTTKNVSRFQTDVLREKSIHIQKSEADSLELEKTIFVKLKNEILLMFQDLKDLSEKIYFIDVMTSHAFLSSKNNYTRPVFKKTNGLEIINGRHPVVENSLLRNNKSFIPNNCVLNQEVAWLMTGPNMAGKSTFLRQTAIIVIMAQIGCYIPADSADLCVVDKIFTRVGASDDLSQGQSTFMTEMVETARILNGSTSNSLVILDEVGRGTSAGDGMALAWAILDFIITDIKCLTLFATHYHKLTELLQNNENIILKTLKSKQWNDEIIFLYKVIDGISQTSFGLHVAKIAGINNKVIVNAEKLLRTISKQESSENEQSLSIRNTESPQIDSLKKIKDVLKNLDLDETTPKQSQEILYNLKNLLES